MREAAATGRPGSPYSSLDKRVLLLPLEAPDVVKRLLEVAWETLIDLGRVQSRLRSRNPRLVPKQGQLWISSGMDREPPGAQLPSCTFMERSPRHDTEGGAASSGPAGT